MPIFNDDVLSFPSLFLHKAQRIETLCRSPKLGPDENLTVEILSFSARQRRFIAFLSLPDFPADPFFRARTERAGRKFKVFPYVVGWKKAKPAIFGQTPSFICEKWKGRKHCSCNANARFWLYCRVVLLFFLGVL